MIITRREFIAATAMAWAGLAAWPGRSAAGTWAGYDRAIVIDGLGGPGAMGVGWERPLTVEQIADVIECGDASIPHDPAINREVQRWCKTLHLKSPSRPGEK